MRILYYSQDYTPHDYRFLSSLAHTAHQVSYLRFETNPQPLETRPLPPEIRVIPPAYASYKPGVPGQVRRFIHLRRVLQELKPDVLHAGPIHTCGLPAAMTGFYPLLLVSWGYDILRDAEANPLMRMAAIAAIQGSAMVCCDSETVKSSIMRMAGYPEEKIVTFPWGIDLKTFAPRQPDSGLRQKLGWQTNKIVISTRRMEKLYGVDVVVSAFGEAVRRMPELRLLLVGTGSMEKEIRGMVAAGGLDQLVHFVGPLSNESLPAYLNEADLYVSASPTDGTSISLLEAMACARPVIVTDIPSNRDWVTNRRNGMLFPPGDSPALARATVEVLSNTSLQKEMGYRNINETQRRADWNKNFAMLLATYERLAGMGRPS